MGEGGPTILPAGVPLPARFEHIREIGAGGMGEVHEVFDREHRRRVALKLLRPHPDAWDLIRAEFRAAVGLIHPNLVRLGELFEVGDRLGFTMELIRGQAFCDWVMREPRRRLRVGVGGLVDGVAALHAAGVVHRDLKPSNVLVTPAGRPVILDFGLAIPAAVDEADPFAVGTPDYMAPEQAGAGVVGPPADLYAIGSMLYECLTGRPPFTGEVMRVLHDKVRADPVPPLELAPECPADLADLCVWLLARDPAARPTAAELRAALDHAPERPSSRTVGRPRPTTGPILGRSPELGLLEQAAVDARRHAVVVLVHGSPGIGTSALLQAFAGGQRHRPGLVAVGRCREREHLRLNAWEGLIDALVGELAGLSEISRGGWIGPTDTTALAGALPGFHKLAVPADELSAGAGLDDVAVDALRGLLARLATERPITAIVDDFQWATDESVALLGQVLAAPAPPVLFVLGHRTAGSRNLGRLIAELAARVDVRHVYLGPLDDDAARRLAARLLGDATGAAQVASASGGHPGVLAQLARDQAAPADALAGRLATLAPATRALAETIAVAARPVSYQLVADALGVPYQQLVDEVEVLSMAGLVRADGLRRADRIAPVDAAARLAVIDGAAPGAVAAAHARLAAVHELDPAGDRELACHHWIGAGDGRRALALAGVLAATDDREVSTRAARLLAAILELPLPPELHVAARRLLDATLGHMDDPDRTDPGRLS